MLQYSQPGPSARSYCASLAFARSRVLLACGVNRLPGSVTNTPPDWTTSVLAVTNAHDESTSCAISFTTRHCSIVLMDRASRFIWDLSCGERDRTLFEQALQTLAQVVQQTHDLALVTDGERRYGLVLFEICQTVIRTGQRGRPRHTLPEGVQVRVKTKAHRPTAADANVPNIRRRNQNIRRRPLRLPNRRFTPIMSKPSTRPCTDA